MKKVLIVDDEKNFRESLVCHLTGKGYHVFQEGDGCKGFEAIENENPDIVLLDVVMDVCDGFEVLNKIRSANLENRPKVIVLSGYSNYGCIAKSLGADHYLPKPIDYDVLSNMMES